MVAHAIELLTAGSDQAEVILQEERYNLGQISIAELHRLVYAQVLSSHVLTWQVSVKKLKMIFIIDQFASYEFLYTTAHYRLVL